MMKNTRRILFVAAFIAIIVGISVLCLIIGRGHSVYFDNKSLEATAYESYSSVELYYQGEKVTSLGKAERAGINLTGQTCKVQFVVKKTKASTPETIDATIKLPYDMDGIVINIPAYVEGGKPEEYLSEFVSLATVIGTEDEEAPSTDEFGLDTAE